MFGDALADVRVLEIGPRGPAAYAGKILTQLGATVTKAELPGGDTLRREGSTPLALGDEPTTAAYEYFNAGKRDVVRVTGDALRALAADADFVICDAGREQFDELDIGPVWEEPLGRRACVSITPFGLEGPYRDFKGGELVTSAFGGPSVGIGEPGREPIKMPLMQGAIQAGVIAVITVLGRVLDIDSAASASSGTELVEISETDVWATVHTGTTLVAYLFRNRLRRRQGRRVLGQPYPHQLFRCADGWVAIQASERHQFAGFVEMVGRPEWVDERPFGSRLDMNDQHADEVDELLANWFVQRNREDVVRACRDRNIPAAPVNTVADVLTDEALAVRDALQRTHTPGGLEVDVPTSPFRLVDHDARTVTRTSEDRS